MIQKNISRKFKQPKNTEFFNSKNNVPKAQRRTYIMKRTIKAVICAVVLALLLCACSDNEALGLVISLNCESTEDAWHLEMTKQGVVDTVGEAERDLGTGDISFVFEAVGEGETELDFYYLKGGETDISKATRVRKYNISVNSDFEITSTLISDEEVTVKAVSVTDKKSAEEILSKELGITDSTDGKEYVLKYIEEYTENGIKWYKFSLSEVVKLDDDKSVLRFRKMYAISESGEVKELDEDEEIPDIELNVK